MSDPDKSRREMVRAVGVAVGAAVLGAVPKRVSAGDVTSQLVPKPNPPSPTDVPRAEAGGEVAALFRDLAPGTKLAGCTLVAVHAVHAGAIPVVLAAPSGRAFQLDVLRREPDAETAAVASTSSFVVSVCNGGDGEHATDEEQGLAAVALAEALARREARGAKAPAALLTLREREAKSSARVLRVRV